MIDFIICIQCKGMDIIYKYYQKKTYNNLLDTIRHINLSLELKHMEFYITYTNFLMSQNKIGKNYRIIHIFLY